MILYINNSKQHGPYKRRDPTKCNKILLETFLPIEFGKTCRKLDFNSFKCSEYKILFFCCFPALLEDHDDPEVIQLELDYFYIYRALNMPPDVFEDLPFQQFEDKNKSFLIRFEKKFGIKNSSYNVHVFVHAPWLRLLRDPTTVSTYGPESFYGQIGRDIKVGTRSETLQALRNSYLKKILNKQDHISERKCKQRLTFRNQETAARDDSLIAITLNTFGKVVHVGESNLEVKMIETTPFSVDPAKNMTWSMIGVACFKKVTEKTVTVPKSKVFGKAVICNGIINSVPRNVLNEK